MKPEIWNKKQEPRKEYIGVSVFDYGNDQNADDQKADMEVYDFQV